MYTPSQSSQQPPTDSLSSGTFWQKSPGPKHASPSCAASASHWGQLEKRAQRMVWLAGPGLGIQVILITRRH